MPTLSRQSKKVLTRQRLQLRALYRRRLGRHDRWADRPLFRPIGGLERHNAKLALAMVPDWAREEMGQ